MDVDLQLHRHLHQIEAEASLRHAATICCRFRSDSTTLSKPRQQNFQLFQTVGDVLESEALPCPFAVLRAIHAGQTTSRTVAARHFMITADLVLMTAQTGPCPEL